MSISGEIIKEYSNGELTVIWKPKSCIHAAECVKQLPNVYNPNAKPWITINNATTDALKSQIDACPSGALTYKLNNVEKSIKMEATTKIDVLENGPLLVHGTMEVTNSNGEKEIKEKTTAFCRCGVSQNKPYCDGAHKKAEFKG
ncbi:hypothetical protein MNBD_BACTEROID02-69 [hydrothermal vent metagenome]|uniref:Iron-binding zinc finger CDGSH type domain-containing protein n=1 Tax=hydrothermal vent metagenome TaxID=652676 RepID=A0A3B0RJG3_9ZZZZ